MDQKIDFTFPTLSISWHRSIRVKSYSAKGTKGSVAYWNTQFTRDLNICIYICTYKYITMVTWAEARFRLYGRKLFLGQSIRVEETYTFQLKCIFYYTNWRRLSVGLFVGVRVAVAHWRNKLALHRNLRNLHAYSRYCSFYSFRDDSINTDRRT